MSKRAQTRWLGGMAKLYARSIRIRPNRSPDVRCFRIVWRRPRWLLRWSLWHRPDLPTTICCSQLLSGPAERVRLGGVPERQAEPASTLRRAGQRPGRERPLQGPARGVHLQRGDVGLQRGFPVGRGRTQATGAPAAGRPGKVAGSVRSVRPGPGERFRDGERVGRRQMTGERDERPTKRSTAYLHTRSPARGVRFLVP